MKLEIELEQTEVSELTRIARRYDVEAAELVSAVARAFVRDGKRLTEVVEVILREDRHNLAMNCNLITEKFLQAGDMERAVRGQEHGVAIMEALVREDPCYRSDLALLLSNLVIVLGKIGKPKEAVAVAKRALDIRKDLYGEAQSSQAGVLLALGLRNYASALHEAGRSAQALKYAEQGVEVYDGCDSLSVDEQHDRAVALYNLGLIAMKLNKAQNALDSGVRAAKLLGELHAQEWTAEVAGHLGGALELVAQCLGKLGRFADAMEAFEKTIAVRERLVAEDGSADIETKAHLALSWVGLIEHSVNAKRDEELVEYHSRVVELFGELYAADPRRFAESYASVSVQYAMRLEDAGRAEDGIRWRLIALPIREKLALESPANGQLELADNLSDLATVLNRTESPEAPRFLERALDAYHAAGVEVHPGVAQGRYNLAVSKANGGRVEDALSDAQTALRLFEQLCIQDGKYENGLGAARELVKELTSEQSRPR